MDDFLRLDTVLFAGLFFHGMYGFGSFTDFTDLVCPNDPGPAPGLALEHLETKTLAPPTYFVLGRFLPQNAGGSTKTPPVTAQAWADVMSTGRRNARGKDLQEPAQILGLAIDREYRVLGLPFYV